LCELEATERKSPQDKSLTVAEAFASEIKSMLPLPEAPFPAFDRQPVKIGKTPYARFDLNNYSVASQICISRPAH
jgi:hypothetical protein